MGHKTLCEWRRHEIPADLKTLRKILRKPKFVCGKCARSANDKEYLCQPLRLKEKGNEFPHCSSLEALKKKGAPY